MPIIPVYITMYPRFFTNVKVIFDNPIYMNKSEIFNKEQIEKKSKELINEIYSLNKKELAK